MKKIYDFWCFLLLSLIPFIEGCENNFDYVSDNEDVVFTYGADSVKIYNLPILEKVRQGGHIQYIRVKIIHPNEESERLNVQLESNDYLKETINEGENLIDLSLPEVKKDIKVKITLYKDDLTPVEKELLVRPVQKREVYIISHSHNDIGYSNLQDSVEKQQNEYIKEALKLSKQTKNYTEDAKYHWNVESLWALENFMRVASKDEKENTIAAIKKGDIGISAGYCNELTGVTASRELYHLLDYSRILRKEFGIESKTYMISDVPGLNWSIIEQFKKRGVKYISSGTNYSTRIGTIREEWGDRPFYWVSQDKNDSLLLWIAGKGYSYFLMNGHLGEINSFNFLGEYMRELDKKDYPFSIVQLRYSIDLDNGGPDPDLPDFIEGWNERFESPRLVSSTIDNMMETFERKYGNQIPSHSGALSPYWEDGVMSSAKEEVLAEKSVQKLIQLETLWEMEGSDTKYNELFYKAWRAAILWHEHTWGAWSSISHPDSTFTRKQWSYKKGFVVSLDSLVKILTSELLISDVEDYDEYEVINTLPWSRSGFVSMSLREGKDKDIVIDEYGNRIESQRLNGGKLMIYLRDIPAKSSRKIYMKSGAEMQPVGEKILEEDGSDQFRTKDLTVKFDRNTGSIIELVSRRLGKNLLDTSKGNALNQYLYISGLDPSLYRKNNGKTQIQIIENGPLMATVSVRFENLPGSESLLSLISFFKDSDKLQIKNVVDKSKVREKESVHFSVPLNIPSMNYRLKLGNNTIMRPNKDQLPASNKDFICVQDWLDVSNSDYGVTISVQGSPLIEIGRIVDETKRQQNPDDISAWETEVDVASPFYFYFMNNYWFTNYRADQEGLAGFQYSLYPHREFDEEFSDRKGIEDNRPLLLREKKSKNL